MTALLCSCRTPVPTSLPISHTDHTTAWWGDHTDYGSRQHYVHVVRDSRGRITEVYRYYWDQHGRPVLDGPRDITRWKGDVHDAGHTIIYRHGRVVRENDLDFSG